MSIAEKLTTIAENEQKVYWAGYIDGDAEGYQYGYQDGSEQGLQIGYTAGKEDGYADGQQAEYDRFWDTFQQNGNRNGYQTAFCFDGWTDETYNPKYPIVAVNGSFAAIYNYSKITDTKVDIILSGTGVNPAQVFNCCFYLVTIRSLDISNYTGSYNNWFAGCSALENITIIGTIRYGMDLHWSTKLSKVSLLNIIDCLEDKSTDTSGTSWVLTIGGTNLAKLTDAEKAIATQKGWTLV